MKLKVGDEIKFYYYYEDKIGKLTEWDGNKGFALSKTIFYPITLSNIKEKLK